MKSFKKLRDFALQGHHKSRERSNLLQGEEGYVEQQGEQGTEEDLELVPKAIEDAKGMQKRYEGLISVSSHVSNCAYDLSTAVEELAVYFSTTLGLIDDKEIGGFFKLVGAVQFDVSKSLELYASDVTQTVTTPTESLMRELQHVMDTKKQFDEKRHSVDQHRESTSRGRPRSGKGDASDGEQLETAREEFNEVSRLAGLGCGFLPTQQGRSSSLVTHAAQHHASQMHLFSKGLASLHGIEPLMKQITEGLNNGPQLCSADTGTFEAEDDGVVSNREVMDDDDGASYSDTLDQEKDQLYVQDEDSGFDSSEIGANAQSNMSREWRSLMEASGSDRHGTSVNEGFDTPMHRWTSEGSNMVPTSPIADSDDVDDIQDVDRSPHRFVSAVPPPTRSPPVPLDEGYQGTLHNDMRTHEYRPSTSERSPAGARSSHNHNAVPASSPRLHGRTTKMGVPMSMFPPFEPSPTSWPMPLPPLADPPPVLSFEAPSLSSTPRGFVTLNSVTPKKKVYSYSGPLTSSAQPGSRPTASDIPGSVPLWPRPSSMKKLGQLKSSRGQESYRTSDVSSTLSPSRMSPPRISELHRLPPPPLSASSSPVTASVASMIAHSARLPRPEPPFLHASPLPLPPPRKVTGGLTFPGPTIKTQKQQWFKGTSTPHLTEVEGAVPSSRQLKHSSFSGHASVLSTPSRHQTGSQSTSLHGTRLSTSAVSKNVTLESRGSGGKQRGSADNKMWRLNTMLHTSPSLTSAYTVSSPSTEAATDARERAQPGNTFELGRRSLDAASPVSNRNSKWSEWSFSAHDRENGYPIVSQTGSQSQESSQMYAHRSSPRHATLNGIRHV